MNPEMVDTRIRQALVKMHVYDRGNNSISYMHIKDILQLIFQNEPIDEKEMMHMMRVSIGIDKRYISDIYKGLLAWKVIFRSEGMIYADKPDEIETHDEVVVQATAKNNKCEFEHDKKCEIDSMIKTLGQCDTCIKSGKQQILYAKKGIL